MQESTYIIYTPNSTEHDLANMLSQQEAFIESELGETYFAMK